MRTEKYGGWRDETAFWIIGVVTTRLMHRKTREGYRQILKVGNDEITKRREFRLNPEPFRTYMVSSATNDPKRRHIHNGGPLKTSLCGITYLKKCETNLHRALTVCRFCDTLDRIKHGA